MSGARSRRSPPTRVEREARRRHVRARAHLARTRTRARRLPATRRAVSAAVFVAALLLGWSVSGSNFLAGFEMPGGAWQLDQIRVQGHAHLSAAEIAAATGVAPGSALSAVSTNVVEERMRAHAWIRDARALALPIGSSGRLWVQVDERVPAARLRSGGGAKPIWVDASGTPFATANGDATRPLPSIRATRAFELGEPNVELAQAMQLIADLRERGLATPFELVLPEDGNADGWRLRFGDPQREVVFGREHLTERVHELVTLFGSELPEVKRADRLDLRFDGRAVLVLADWGVRGKSASR